MIIDCDFCLKELREPGALLFSPPAADNRVVKQHMCCDCYRNLDDNWDWSKAKRVKLPNLKPSKEEI